MDALVDRPVILAPCGTRKHLALYDLIGNKEEAERGSDRLVKGAPRRKTEE
jgi:hypothetical protein